MVKMSPENRTSILVKAIAGAMGILMCTPVLADTRYEYAQVLESRPVYRSVEVSVPRQECWDEEIAHTDSVRPDSNTSAIIGTIIGGALGNAVGHNKSNKRVGAVVGAVLGHSIGRDIVASNSRERVVRYETVRQCETVYEYHDEERLIGYDVVYRYNDQDYSVRMDEDPGERVRVKVNVQPVF